MSQEEDIYKGKEVSYYEVTLNSWYLTKLEKDKSLLSIASAGIGLLVTLATTVGIANAYTALIYGIAVLSFLGCILFVLAVFNRNATYLESILREKSDSDPLLKPLDMLANALFISGIVFTLLVGIFSGINKFNSQESAMTKKEVNNSTDSTVVIKKSWDGASALRPQKPAEQQPPAEQPPQKPTTTEQQ